MSRRSFWILTLGGALAATILTHWERNNPIPAFLEPVADALNVVHAAAARLSAVLSGSHNPSVALEYGVLFASYVLLFVVLVGIVRLLNR
jgi:hypothetical protein